MIKHIIMRLIDFVGLTALAILFGVAGCAQPPENQDTRRPNILVCISDDQSYPHASAYGTTWVNTPAFDRVASRGILFGRAYTPNAKCAPSRSCLLTGRNPWQLEEAANHTPFFPAKFKTYAELLAEHGYTIGYTGKGWAPGNPGQTADARRELLGPGYNNQQLTPPTSGISRIDYAENFREFLSEKADDQPFCFWFGALEPHRAFEYGSGQAKGGMRPEQIDSVYSFWPDVDSVRTDLLDYAFEINYFDQQLGRIITLLEEAGELENTLIIVTSDNGMAFPRVKGQAYEQSNHLPLAMMWPNGIQHPGRRYDQYVSFTDFAPTFLEVAGIDTAGTDMAPFEGNSLVPVFAGREDPNVRPYMVVGKERHDVGRPNDWGYPIRGIFKGGFLYLRNFEISRWPAGNPETGYLDTDGSPTKSVILHQRRYQDQYFFWNLSFGLRGVEELYDLTIDSDCLHNLAADAKHAQLKTDLFATLKSELESEGDPRVFGRGEVFDNYPYAKENVRHFHKRFSEGEAVSAGWVNKDDFEPSKPKH